MARYIEEEAFVNFVQEHYCNGCNNYNGVKCKSCSVDDAISFVESAPTADVVPKSKYDLSVAEREANVKGFIEQVEALSREIKALRAFKAYWDNLYGEDLEIAYWHQNGDLEPFDNFYESAEAELEKKYVPDTNAHQTEKGGG